MKHTAKARGLLWAAKLCLVMAAVGLSWRCGPGGVTPSGGAGGFSERRLADSLRAGRTAAARSYVEAAIRHASDSDSLHLYRLCLADVELAEARPDEARRLWRESLAWLAAREETPLRLYMKIKVMKLRSVYYSAYRFDASRLLASCREALELAGRYGDASLHIVCLSNLGDAYRQTGQPALAADCYRRSIALADSTGAAPDEYVSLYQGLATTLTTVHDFAHSRLWWERARSLAPYMSREERFNYYNNRGNDYYYRGDYDSCRLMFMALDSLLDTYPSTEWERQFCRTNLLDVCLRLGRTHEARSLLGPALAYFESEGAAVPLSHLRTQQMELARLEGRPEAALALARRHPLPPDAKPEQRLLRLEALMRSAEAAGRWREAFGWQELHRMLADSVGGWATRERIEMDRLTYERDTTLIRQRMELSVARSQLMAGYAWLAVAVLLLVAAVAALLAHRRRARERERRLYNDVLALRMRNVRQRITPHFMANALNHESLARRDGHGSQLSTLSALLRQGQALADELAIPLSAELRFIDFYVQVEAGGLPEGFSYEKRVEDGIDADAVAVPSMAVQILVENALKHGLRGHAFAPGETPRLAIGVKRTAGGTLVEVSNNGRPYVAPAPDSPTGTGLRVIRQTLLLLNMQNDVPMTFTLRPAAGDDGCTTQACLFVPDGYRFDLPALCNGSESRGGAQPSSSTKTKRNKRKWLPYRK